MEIATDRASTWPSPAVSALNRATSSSNALRVIEERRKQKPASVVAPHRRGGALAANKMNSCRAAAGDMLVLGPRDSRFELQRLSMAWRVCVVSLVQFLSAGAHGLDYSSLLVGVLLYFPALCYWHGLLEVCLFQDETRACVTEGSLIK